MNYQFYQVQVNMTANIITLFDTSKNIAMCMQQNFNFAYDFDNI